MAIHRSNISNFSSQILIVGGGLCGIATAIALRRSGQQVIVFERMSALLEIGAGIQLPPNATRILQEWNVLQPIMQYAYMPKEGSLRSYRGTVLTRQTSGKEIEEEYGSPYLVIHRADLLKVLVSEAKNLGVDIKLGANVSKINFENPSITLSTGEVFSGHMVLGADGERSMCRGALLGHPDIPQSTGDVVFRIAIKRDNASQLQSLKELMEQPTVNVWLGPDSHAVTYLLKNDILNVVLVTRDKIGGKTIYGPQEASISELKAAFAGWDPIFETILDVKDSDCTKWTLLHINEVESWCHPSGKFALIGDAAHAMLPYLAQGAAQAFEDAAVLGTLFADIKDLSQIPDAMFAYEKLRKPRAMEVRKRTLDQKIMYGLHDGPHQEARDQQLALTTPMENMQEWLWGNDVLAEAKRMSEIVLS
ncbi:hypothetical protein DSL72_001618 [Monilinia vaccinii-corymbosi]|uniref:FAD-binding domain-containing protein n=1 Tax=Monilinia vaccinii-corymbosi TaxID=61207 RepID=A0A8A3PA78_9HELO|nr:hypothetical protein DSL72_001618 [Monilinia vaccinii-corymbosi]